MKVRLVNPSYTSFGTSVITPQWLYVLAAVTPVALASLTLVDQTLEQLNPASIGAGKLVGIGIQTGNALRGYEVGRRARKGVMF
jgi:hypothetical protein